jgi:hypothetical protein
MALEIRASDIRDFAADVADMQDSGRTHQGTRTKDNSIQETRDKDGNMSIVLNSYQKYWIYEKPYGHDIVIWTDVGKLTIECKWPNRKRNNDGRVTDKK